MCGWSSFVSGPVSAGLPAAEMYLWPQIPLAALSWSRTDMCTVAETWGPDTLSAAAEQGTPCLLVNKGPFSGLFGVMSFSFLCFFLAVSRLKSSPNAVRKFVFLSAPPVRGPRGDACVQSASVRLRTCCVGRDPAPVFLLEQCGPYALLWCSW